MNLAFVGAFVLALGAALVGCLLWLGSGGAFRKPVDLYSAVEEESVAGLNVNAPVKYNGVDVGKVDAIALDPANPDRVLLTLAVARGTPIQVDTEAVLKTQGLTGIAYVELGGGKLGSPRLTSAVAGRYPVIRTIPSLSARLENVLTTVLTKIDSTSTNIDALLSPENRVAFSSALRDIAVVTHAVAARRQSIDAGLAGAAITAQNAARVTAQMGPLIDRIGRSADALQLMGTETAAAGAGAGKAVEATGAEVQRFSAQTLPELQRLMGELSELSAALRRLSEQTERQPESLLFGRRAPAAGPGETHGGEKAR